MNNEKTGIRADFNMITILTIPIAIAINYVGSTLAGSGSRRSWRRRHDRCCLPIYLDTIGTFLIALIAGPWVGGLTGALSNIMVSLTHPVAMPYAIVSCIFGVTAGFMARKGMFINIKRFILSGALVVMMGVLGTIFVVLTFFGGFDGSTNSMIVAAMRTMGVPFWLALVIGNFISEIPDKFIALLVPYLVIKGMSDRYLYKFSNGHVFIEARKKAKEEKKKAD
jgi:energy-coupling factor transport system substrate-specific component